MNTKTKKLLILNIPYLILALLFTKVSQAWRLAAGYEFASKVLTLPDGFVSAFENPFPSLHSQDLVIGILFGKRFKLNVELIGGIILFLIGTKILIEHLWIESCM